MFLFKGKPDPPRNLSITGVSESTADLKWEEPELDGGSAITGYVIEMRASNKKTWTKVDTSESLEFTITKLAEGTEYVFRVAAQNAVGVGEFVELQKPVAPKGQFGMSRLVLLA
jgi:titin